MCLTVSTHVYLSVWAIHVCFVSVCISVSLYVSVRECDYMCDYVYVCLYVWVCMSRCTLMWACECACGCVKFCCSSASLECLQAQKGEKRAAASHTIKTNWGQEWPTFQGGNVILSFLRHINKEPMPCLGFFFFLPFHLLWGWSMKAVGIHLEVRGQLRRLISLLPSGGPK